MKHIIFIFLLSNVTLTFGQAVPDTVSNYETTNRPKNKFWGNSTYVSTALNFSKNQEYDINIGRTFGKSSRALRGLGTTETYSWGVGYGFSNSFGKNQTVKAFYEYDMFPTIILFNIGLRGEYIYDIDNKQSYVRPSVGWSFLYFNILYNYSFKLNGGENMYKHGVLIRAKYFLFKKNWQNSRYVGPY